MATSYSSSSSSKGGEKVDDRPHVLAVDDSLIDRKLMERLLTTYACKGSTFHQHFIQCYVFSLGFFGHFHILSLYGSFIIYLFIIWEI